MQEWAATVKDLDVAVLRLALCSSQTNSIYKITFKGLNTGTAQIKIENQISVTSWWF